MTDLDKLKILTTKLHDFPKEINIDCDNSHKEYKMEKGVCHSWLIYTNATTVAVHKWYNSKGSKFPEHNHSVTETITVFEGSMKLNLEGKLIVLKEQDSYTIHPHCKHSAIFEESCRYITVTVPPAPEFPGVSGEQGDK